LAIATARAGNVIGGGDWAEDRIIPDAMRALAAGQSVPVRNPNATRPWQHVLEPLGGYMRLAEALAMDQTIYGQPNPYAEAFNFGPLLEANRPVRQLIEACLQYWSGIWHDLSDPGAVHETGHLNLQSDKSKHRLDWQPRWPFAKTVERTVAWYQAVHHGVSAIECCMHDLALYDVLAAAPPA